ncbi:MAG: ATP synthase F1 subunit gamma [Capsulimonas sp.]|uniref:ATP synthase F1 subunit gamma n=1 Tax=Capsulimonas sp. TaxID=2494211 RepID=UPI003265A943
MATPRQIRARIRTAKNIQQITKAMKMVAAARLRRAQEAVGAARPYAEKMREVMASLSNGSDGVQHPLLRKIEGEPKKIGLILITADRGLAGAYNSSVIKRAIELVRPYGPENVKIVSVGKKGAVFFKRRGFSVVSENPVPQTGISFMDAQTLSRTARRLFEDGEIDALYVIYTQFVSAMTQRPQTVQILPLQPLESAADAKPGPKADYIFEPNPEQILSSLLPRYVDTQVFQSVIESVASEHGARMTSMSAATDNAGKMISGLTLTLNRARQAAITKEIAEIVGGAEALK